MDKTTAFLGGVIAGTVTLGVAAWFFAEYLPNQNKAKEYARISDSDDATDERVSDTDDTTSDAEDTTEAADGSAADTQPG